MPAQMGGAGFPPGAVAQQEHRAACLGGPEAQAPACSEIEQFGEASHIGHHGGHRPAGDGLLGCPEQLVHVGNPHQHQRIGVETEADEARTVRHAQLLGLVSQLQIDDGQALRAEQSLGLSQGEAQGGPSIASLVGEDLLQQSSRKHGERTAAILDPLPHLPQGRLALDVGNGVPQRGEALLAIGGAHGSHL